MTPWPQPLHARPARGVPRCPACRVRPRWSVVRAADCDQVRLRLRCPGCGAASAALTHWHPPGMSAASARRRTMVLAANRWVGYWSHVYPLTVARWRLRS